MSEDKTKHKIMSSMNPSQKEGSISSKDDGEKDKLNDQCSTEESAVQSNSAAAEGSMKEKNANLDANEKALDAASVLTSLVDQTPKLNSISKDIKEGPTTVRTLPVKESNILLMQHEKVTRSGRKKATPFSVKLMTILEQNEEYGDIIRWLPDGKAFIIVNPKKFTSDVLPTFFKEAKYSSFTRKLHRWGFQRHLRGDLAGAFFHPHFQRGRVELLDQMGCNKPVSSQSQDVQRKNVLPNQGFGGIGSSYQNLYGNPSMASQQTPSSAPFSHHHGPSPFGSYQMQAAMQGGAETLDMAIELEVTRRLRERISAVSSFQQQQPLSSNGGDTSRGPPDQSGTGDAMSSNNGEFPPLNYAMGVNNMMNYGFNSSLGGKFGGFSQSLTGMASHSSASGAPLDDRCGDDNTGPNVNDRGIQSTVDKPTQVAEL